MKNTTTANRAAEEFAQHVAQAKTFVAEERWEDAIAQYKKALTASSSPPLWIYITLGSILAKAGKTDEAIRTYRQAIAIDDSQPKIYPLLGIALEQKQLTNPAINSYRKALQLNPEQPAWVHKKLADLLQKRAQADAIESAIGYSHFLQKQDRFSILSTLNDSIKSISGYSPDQLEKSVQTLTERLAQQDPAAANCVQRLSTFGFIDTCNNNPVNPAGYYFVSHHLKAVYCSIPKNACTLFKTMIVSNSQLKAEFEDSGKNIHSFLNQKSSQTSADSLLHCLSSDDYFKFVIIRNPFSRIVSGYLDKFAKHTNPEPFVRDIISAVQLALGIAPDIKKSITFEQFVDYLFTTPDAKLNDHWRPQHNFVANVDFDYVGQFEKMDSAANALEQILNIRIDKKVSKHITQYKRFDEDMAFHTMYPQQLRSLPGMPFSSQLFSPDLEQKIRTRYTHDIALYRREFGVDPYV